MKNLNSRVSWSVCWLLVCLVFLPLLYSLGSGERRHPLVSESGKVAPTPSGLSQVDAWKELGESFSDAVRKGDSANLEMMLAEGFALNDWEQAREDGALALAVRYGQAKIVPLLLRHGAKPSRPGVEGFSPLLMSIAKNDAACVQLFLEAGEDANQLFPRAVSDQAVALTENKIMRWFLRHERRLTPLMMAANHGNATMIQELLRHGAKAHVRSARYQLTPLNFASRRKDIKTMQVMLGADPRREKFAIIVDLSEQWMRLLDADGATLLSSQISSGKAGSRTPAGEFVITDKHLDHESTIHKVRMPYFQRLSCSAVGFHAGHSPGYPASHGCIRLPEAAAKKIFQQVPVGTRVTIQD